MRRLKCPYGDINKTFITEHSLRHHIEMNHSVGEEMVSAIVKKIVLIPDGKHLGIITALELRTTEKFGDYLDMELKVSDVPDGVITTSMPLNVSVKSDLGKFLMAMGFNITKHEEEKIDLDKILIGKAVSFQTFTTKDEKGRDAFQNVIKETLQAAEK